MPSSGFLLCPSVQPIHYGGVWRRHGRGHMTQTWHGSFPNDYNMLNLLSSPPSCKFSKKEPDLDFSSMLWIQRKFLKPRRSKNCNSLFSHCLLQEASPPVSLEGADQNYQMKPCIHWRYKLWRANLVSFWNNKPGMCHVNKSITINTSYNRTFFHCHSVNTVAVEIGD